VEAAQQAEDEPLAGNVEVVGWAKTPRTVGASGRGTTRQFVSDISSGAGSVRFVRAADGKRFGEQAATLDEILPGWTVSVKTNHQGDREVADTVRVVHER